MRVLTEPRIVLQSSGKLQLLLKYVQVEASPPSVCKVGWHPMRPGINRRTVDRSVM